MHSLSRSLAVRPSVSQGNNFFNGKFVMFIKEGQDNRSIKNNDVMIDLA